MLHYYTLESLRTRQTTRICGNNWYTASKVVIFARIVYKLVLRGLTEKVTLYLAATSEKRRKSGLKWVKCAKVQKCFKMKGYFARKTIHALSNASIVRSRTTSGKVTTVYRKVTPPLHVHTFRACKNYHVAVGRWRVEVWIGGHRCETV